MLIEFTVGNFRSFKEKTTLSMVAAKIKSRDARMDENNTFEAGKNLRLLSSAPIYGANASGKSNLVKAMAFMCYLVTKSSRDSQAGDMIPVEPFRLNASTEKEPAFFETTFIMDGILYRYGFEVTPEKIVTEWLFFVPSTKEAMLFVRDEYGIKLSSKFKEGRGLEDKTRTNALFLSVVAQFNGAIARSVLGWFQQIGFISGLDDVGYKDFTISMFADGKYRAEIIHLIKKFDLGIDSVVHETIEKSKVSLPSDMPDEIKNLVKKDKLVAIKTIHEKWDTERPIEQVAFYLGEESEGTQKLFFLAGPILDTLSQGRVLFVDEMETRLHPLITRSIIALFHSSQTNPNHAQIVFTTHDTNLLSKDYFRRDQIWFIEKDRQGGSHLYSLAELKVRNDASFESDYIEGRYGAIPFIGNIHQVFTSEE